MIGCFGAVASIGHSVPPLLFRVRSLIVSHARQQDRHDFPCNHATLVIPRWPVFERTNDDLDCRPRCNCCHKGSFYSTGTELCAGVLIPRPATGPAEDLQVLGSPIRHAGLRPHWPDYGCWIFSTNPPLTVITPSAGIVHKP